jgi:MFS transporter, PHS family, inorganic phosphate transporter
MRRYRRWSHDCPRIGVGWTIMSAKIFPTRYRATCYGISAAAGKLGSVVQLFLTSTNTTNFSTKLLLWSLIAFSFAMALGGVFAWAWIPEVQDVNGPEVKRIGWRGRCNEVPSKTLKELAIGRIGLVDQRRMIGFQKVTNLLNWMKRLLR